MSCCCLCRPVPSPVRNVSAATYTPNSVNVKWRLPADPRGRLDDVIYVIEWHTNNTDGSRSEGRSQVSRKVIRSESSTTGVQDRTAGTLSTLVPGLKHSHVYVIRVGTGDIFLHTQKRVTPFRGSGRLPAESCSISSCVLFLLFASFFNKVCCPPCRLKVQCQAIKRLIFSIICTGQRSLLHWGEWTGEPVQLRQCTTAKFTEMGVHSFGFLPLFLQPRTLIWSEHL